MNRRSRFRSWAAPRCSSLYSHRLREVVGGRVDDGLLQRFQLAVWPDGAGPWRHVDRWPNAAARARAVEIFQRLNTRST